MKKTIACLLLQLISIIVVSSLYASDSILIPDPRLIGKSMHESNTLFANENAKAFSVFPIQLVVDLDDGKISGLIAYYDSSIAYKDIVKQIDNRYGVWEKESLRTESMRIYRVEVGMFVINLSKNEEGESELILLPISGN